MHLYLKAIDPSKWRTFWWFQEPPQGYYDPHAGNGKEKRVFARPWGIMLQDRDTGRSWAGIRWSGLWLSHKPPYEPTRWAFFNFSNLLIALGLTRKMLPPDE